MKKEMFTDYSRLEIGLVDGDKVYCRKGNEVDIYKAFERMKNASEAAAIIDKGVVIRCNPDYLVLSQKKIYGAPSNKKLAGYFMSEEEISEEALVELKKETHRKRLFDRMHTADMEDLNGMCRVEKGFIYERTSKDIALATSEAIRFLKTCPGHYNPRDVLFELNVETPVDNEYTRKRMTSEELMKLDKANAWLDMIKVNGFKSKRGYTFRYLCASASNSRKNTIMFIREDVYDVFMKWACCGLELDDLGDSPAKRDARLGLLFSNSITWEDVFGKSVDIRRVAVVPDLYITKSGVVDFITLKKEIQHNVCRDIKINAFDGMGVIFSDFADFTGTARGPFLKPSLFKQDRELVRNEYGETFVDRWGKTIHIDDVDIVLTESCFKMVDRYASWEAYCDAYEALGHHFCVCIKDEQSRLKDSPYQEGQTLLGDHDDAETFAKMAAGQMAAYSKIENVPKLLGGSIGRAIELCPSLANNWYIKLRMQEVYESKLKRLLGGRLPRIGTYALCAADPVAFWQHVFGHEVTGCLAAGTVAFNRCRTGLVDVCRNPHLDHAHVLMRNTHQDKRLFTDNVIFLPIYDLISIRLRLDYDGDHLLVSDCKELIDLVKKTNTILKHPAFDWETPPAYKAKWSKAVEARMIDLRKIKDRIGISVNDLTKLWNWFPTWLNMHNKWHKIDKRQLNEFRKLPKNASNGKKRRVNCSIFALRHCSPIMFREAVLFFTFVSNVFIDAAKHGGAAISYPVWLRRLLKDLPFPKFMKYAKEKEDDKITFTGSFLDMYSDLIAKSVPETLEVENIDNMIFVPSMITVGQPLSINGLAQRGRGVGNGKYVDGGFFTEIAGRHSEMWKELKAEDDDAWFKCMENRNLLALREIEEWAKDRGYTIEDAYSAIVAVLFKPDGVKYDDSKNIKYYTMMQRAFWDIFGEHVIEVLEAKKAAEAIEKSAAEDCDAKALPF